MLLRCLAGLALSTIAALGDDIALSRVGDPWTYRLGVSEPSSVPGAWQRLEFNDDSWSSGRSGFSAGYAPPEATPLPDVEFGYSSVYFRRRLTVEDPGQIQWLTLRVDYTDGYIACLNGREIARRNLEGAPDTLVPFDRLATNFHVRSQPEEIDVSAFRNALVKGQNLLSIQLHRAQTNSLTLCLSAELMANFNRAPYLQDTSTNGVQIIWKTPVPADTRLEYGLDAALGTTLLDTNLLTTHVATLTHLLPDTSYLYRALSSADGLSATSSVQTFRTFKPAGPVRFLVFGDGGWNSEAQFQLAQVVQDRQPDFVLEVGDVCYPSFTAALADPRCFSPYEPHMRTTPYFFALGNHDLYSGVESYLDAFYLPTNSVPLADHAAAHTSPEHYYSFDEGDAHFTVLFVPFVYQYKMAVGDAQYTWLTNDLAATRQPWKIVFCHVPMNSSSAHRFDDFDFNGVPDRLDIREVLLPVLSRYGVQLVLSGHEHGYERFNPTNGVHFVTTAGGGGELYGLTQLDFASALFWPRYNCLQVDIHGDTLEAQALGTQGEVFDAMTIQRRLPPLRVFQSAWHSPVVESFPADNGDGNISGQRFDFQGEPILTLSGQFSNLGRAYVNNDRDTLYIGLDRVMIYPNNNVFLFLESPRMSGVASLTGLGNGIVDPDGQGADGLDFLSNLSFTNFSPGVGCILGDKFGDGQYRSFLRTNLALNIGQGIFRLDAGLSDIPGTRLQQFTLSPESGGVIGEPNAQYIELAIPLSELGGLQPGEFIRLGAVVGGGEFSVEAQTRALDSGFLGNGLVSAGQGPAILDGVEVQLALEPALTVHFELAVGPRLRIWWQAIPGWRYQVQSSGSPISDFRDLPGASLVASEGTALLTYNVDFGPSATPWQFFRVYAEQPAPTPNAPNGHWTP